MKPEGDGPAWADGIYALKLEGTATPTLLPLSGRDDCSFHPQGLSLVAAKGHEHPTSYLYVVNQHDASGSRPGSGCPAGGSSIEVFRVEPKRLVFLRRMFNPEVLTNANDLVALPDGTVWVTNPPRNVFDHFLERLGISRSKLVRFSCGKPKSSQPGCPGDFKATRPFGRYLNGIVHRATVPGTGELFVSASGDDRIYRAPIRTEPLDMTALPWFKTPMPDNLSWAAEGRELLVANLLDVRGFLQHRKSGSARSPSRITRFSLDSGRQDPTLEDDGRFLSAASVAVQHDGRLYIGQVFGSFILRCELPVGGES